MDLAQAMLMNRNNNTIGKIPMNQTNGSPVMEYILAARSSGIAQPRAAITKYATAPAMFDIKRIEGLCVFEFGWTCIRQLRFLDCHSRRESAFQLLDSL